MCNVLIKLSWNMANSSIDKIIKTLSGLNCNKNYVLYFYNGTLIC